MLDAAIRPAKIHISIQDASSVLAAVTAFSLSGVLSDENPEWSFPVVLSKFSVSTRFSVYTCASFVSSTLYFWTFATALTLIF